MKYVIPAILAFLSGLLLWQVQRPRVSLDYEVVTSEEFPRAAGVGRYFVVRVRNTGNREVRDIDLRVALRSGTVETKQFSVPSLISQVSESQSEVTGRIPLLNPNETFSVTLTGAGNSGVGPLEVTARAPGATAGPRTADEMIPSISNMLTGAVAVALAALVVSLFSSYRTSNVSRSISQIQNLGELSERIQRTEEDLSASLQHQRQEMEKAQQERERELQKARQEHEKRLREEEQGAPSTEQLVFSVFNRAGLSNRFAELVGGADAVRYWKTGLFLLNGFLVDVSNRDKYVAAAEAVVELPGMAPSSRGFNLYLLGKMEQYRGNSDRAIHWFERCRTVTPLMYAHVMAQDPAYDLASIRVQLLGETAPPNKRLHPTAGDGSPPGRG